MPTSFAILGDGAWGTAIALLLAQNPDHRVTLWSAREENGRLLQQHRENIHLLPGVAIPRQVQLTMDPREATYGADVWIAAIPTVYIRATLQRLKNLVHPDRPVISLAKGLEIDTFLLPSEIISQVLGVDRLAVLSGPSHAEEVSQGQPTTVTVASSDFDLARWVQRRFTTDRFRVYTNLDRVGVELAGALKNIIALASGISDGLGFGDNARAALMTRGLTEMTRFGVALGAEAATFYGLAGVGDLFTTCASPHGRNRLVGQRIGQGEKPADVLASMPKVAEGVYTTRSVYERSRRMGIDMPITTEVYRVLYEGKAPATAVNDLMMRTPKQERERL